MLRSKPFIRAALAAALFVSSLPLAAQQQQKYHLELEATPAAVFPYFGRFGKVELDAYAGGVRAEALWLNSFSRNGESSVTVINPLGRMYVDVPIEEIPFIVQRLAGTAAGIERVAIPTMGPVMNGKVGTVAATRHRLVYGDAAYIDIWMTKAVPENMQLRRIVDRLLAGISPGTAGVVSQLRGNPIHVELNFRRFKKVELLKLKKLTMAADDEKDALTLGSLYVRASILEKLFND